jgi:hypothetical protein
MPFNNNAHPTQTFSLPKHIFIHAEYIERRCLGKLSSPIISQQSLLNSLNKSDLNLNNISSQSHKYLYEI